MSYTNADGLYTLTGPDQGVVETRGTAVDEIRKSFIYNIDFKTLGSSFGAGQIDPNAPTLPAGAYIVDAYLIMTEAATSGGSATLTIGTYLPSGTAVVAAGITSASALTTIDAVGEVLKCAGSAVNAAATVGANAVHIGALYGTAAFTAGKGKLVVEYVTV